MEDIMWNRRKDITYAINDSDVVKSDTNFYAELMSFGMFFLGLGFIYYRLFPESNNWGEFSANASIIYIFARLFLGEIVSALGVCLFILSLFFLPH